MDERLRELERLWKQTGTVEAEVEYLHGRLRFGDVTREQLGAAAYCKHPAALLALGDDGPKLPAEEMAGYAAGARFDYWLMGLGEIGPGAGLRALAIAIEMGEGLGYDETDADGHLTRMIWRARVWGSDAALDAKALPLMSESTSIRWAKSLAGILHRALEKAQEGQPVTPLLANVAYWVNGVTGLREDDVRSEIERALLAWGLGPAARPE